MYYSTTIKRFIVFLFSTLVFSCSKNKDLVQRPIIDPVIQADPYSNGLFIIGEGAYGKSGGTVLFYAYGSDSVSTRVYEKENPGKQASNAAFTSSLQFASMINKKIYLVSKMNGPILKLDAGTLREEARYNQETSNWRSILAVNPSTGLVSAADGVYSINLKTLAIQNKINSLGSVNSGDMIKAGKYIYVLQSSGAKIINVDNYGFVKGFSNINRGFAQTPNGKVWGGTANRLIAFDKNGDTTGVALTTGIGSFGVDAPTVITASTKENAIFYHSGTKIYKYVDGVPESVSQPFITITESPFMVYGAIRYDKNRNYIVVNGIKGYGAAATVNYLLLYEASTGLLVKKIQYGGEEAHLDFNKIYFPNLSIFQ